MARTPAQRGSFGWWLKQAREARYRTQALAIADVRRLAGTAISPSEWAQWESGSRTPRPDNPKVARLYEFFGGPPTDALEATESGDALAAAINALVAELRAAREAREADVVWRRSVDSELSHLAQRVAAALPERSAPRG